MDTIPIVVKFFSTAGPYDNVVKLNEECYARSSQTAGTLAQPINFELTTDLGFGELITRKSSFERYLDLEREKLANLDEPDRKTRSATLNDLEMRFNFALAKLISNQLTQVSEAPEAVVSHPAHPPTPDHDRVLNGHRSATPAPEVRPLSPKDSTEVG